MKRTLFAFLTLALALGGSALAGGSQPQMSPPTRIAVSGTGTVQMMPDQATVNATIMTNDNSSERAISQNNAIYDRVVAAVTKLGVSRGDLVLSNYSVYYNPRPKGVTNPGYQRYGYTVNRSFSVAVHDIAKAGSAVDALTGAGASNINGIQFGLSHQAAAQAQALRSAVADAHAKALAIATAAHLRLVGLKSIGLGYPQQFPRPMMLRAVGVPSATPTQFDASNVAVTVTVSAVYLAAP